MLKKCAVINDLSGFGKCSLTAVIPIISAMGVEVHPLLTAALSNQTAYDSYKSISLTETMMPFIDEWKKMNASFDSILTGFVTDEKQLDVINTFVDIFNDNDTILVVDPVMADNGKLYDGYTTDMCNKIKELCIKADVITPNISELAILVQKEYSDNYDDICSYAKLLLNDGIKNIVVTGYKDGNSISNIIFSDNSIFKVTAKQIGGYYSGTGDIFASIIAGGLTKGITLFDCVTMATSFIEKAVKNTSVDNPNDGVEFEKILGDLIL